MNSTITRPVFFEGQRLAADDLDGVVDYGRAKRERHDRFVHRWGIVHGLELTPESGRVFAEPGIAVDGEGREIALLERAELDPDRFQQTQGANIDPDALYPVFLISQYVAQAPTPGPPGACGSTAGTRIDESHDLSFGRLGDEVGLDEQVPSGLDSHPTPGEGGGAWLILLGFVQWDDANENFADAVAENSEGIARRYVGVNADVVAGHAGRLQLQTRDALTAGNPVLELSETDGGQLCFGRYTAHGKLEKLLTIASNGDVRAAGALTGRLTTGAVQVQSGVATHGALLPLPPGITQEQVADGSATLYALVTPRIDPRHAPDPTLDWAALVQECRVDAERRVHCRICWFDLDFTAGGIHGQNLVAQSGTCEYLVLGTTNSGESS